jgi:hypothetical protein
MKIETLPLMLISHSPNSILTEVKISVDGKPNSFLLDTGQLLQALA